VEPSLSRSIIVAQGLRPAIVWLFAARGAKQTGRHESLGQMHDAMWITLQETVDGATQITPAIGAVEDTAGSDVLRQMPYPELSPNTSVE
jgi:hypothetical protein